jgi:hypothetical protein
MSHDLVEIIRRHQELGAPSALEVLKDALADAGAISPVPSGTTRAAGDASMAARRR